MQGSDGRNINISLGSELHGESYLIASGVSERWTVTGQDRTSTTNENGINIPILEGSSLSITLRIDQATHLSKSGIPARTM